MANIIVNYKPFVIKQDVLVYEEGACVEKLQAPIDMISDIIGGLQSRYEIDEINLLGSQDYLSRFQAELGLKFANSNIEINIISK